MFINHPDVMRALIDLRHHELLDEAAERRRFARPRHRRHRD